MLNIFSQIKGEKLTLLTVECVEWYEKNGHPSKTTTNLRNLLRRFLRFAGNRELTVELCKEYVAFMQEKSLRNSSINSDIGRIKMFLSWLYHEKNATTSDLGKNIRRPKIRIAEDAPEQLLSANRMAELIDVVTTPAKRKGKLAKIDAKVNKEYREFLHFYRKMGLRPGEARGIKPEHVNLDGDPPSVTVWRSKGGRGGKWVRLGLPLDYLEPIRERVNEGRWFDVHETGLQIKMKKISELAGMKLNLYSIRKSVDTGLIDNGADLMTAATHQGHTPAIMQQYYYKMSAKRSSQMLNQSNPHINRAKVPIEYMMPDISKKHTEWSQHPQVQFQSETITLESGEKEVVYTMRIKL